jgi:hypothetical protein
MWGVTVFMNIRLLSAAEAEQKPHPVGALINERREHRQARTRLMMLNQKKHRTPLNQHEETTRRLSSALLSGV